MPLNNELAAARGEAAAAEEKVMWQLTGQVIDNLADMQAALAIVSTSPDASCMLQCSCCCCCGHMLLLMQLLPLFSLLSMLRLRSYVVAATAVLYSPAIKAGLGPEKPMH